MSMIRLLHQYQAEKRAETIRSGCLFRTRSKLQIDFLNFSVSDVRLEDIAAGLSKLCRYTGQCERFYSVAEHCTLGSRLPELDLFCVLGQATGPRDPKLSKSFFVHDSPEAYLGDANAPLKALLPGYKLIEERFESVIDEAFSLDVSIGHETVKRLDRLMYLREDDELMESRGECPAELYDLIPELPCWSPDEAKKAFLERAEELGIVCPSMR